MCLKVTKGPFKAKKKFYTVKMVEKMQAVSCRTPFRQFICIYGSHYFTVLDKPNSCHEVNRGLHSLLVGRLHKSNWALHAWYTGFVLCEIPKGTTYYIGDDGDIASDNLIVVEPIAENTSHTKWGKPDEVEINDSSLSLEVIKDVKKYIQQMNYNIKPS